MKQMAHPQRIVFIILCLLSDYLIAVNSHVCEVGRVYNHHNEWKWVLPYPDPCKCTNIIMGGMNTLTPIRPFIPIYVDSPLLSEDIIAIREHYGLTCNTGTTSDFTETSSCLSGTDSSAGTLDTATTKSQTENDATAYSDISFSSQGEASGTDGTEAETSEHALTTASGSTAAESSTDSATSSPRDTSGVTSTEAGTSEHALTTDSGSTTAKSSTNSVTSDPSETSEATSTEAGTSITTSPTTSISASSSTTPKVCNESLGMENGDIPDGNIAASHFYSYQTRSYPPSKGRLNGDSYWSCKASLCSSEATTWIQADIGYQTYVSGVITQGDGGGSSTYIDWVTSLKVSTFEMTAEDQQVFVTDENSEVKVFEANTDRDTPVTLTFPDPVYARIVRITCISRNTGSSFWNIRFEILGCKQATH